MPPTPSPTPVEVFVYTGPAEWWQILAALGPLAVILGAVIAGVIGWRTLEQKAEADNRAEWWRRTQWALDAVYSGDTNRGTIGLKVLKILGDSELAGDGELAVLEAASEKSLDHAAQVRAARAKAEAQSPHAAATHAAPTSTMRAHAEPEAAFDDGLAMQIAAAQLREVTDRRLSKVTPEWVTDLAHEQSPGHTA
ncbi:hypothetical protein [Arthrobacter sp. CG_A4]|uniref:hypothetical protein n=1 Tax=Arthrobacter sp. CG_A4 TaxID=3071706 RepID=UPI002DFB789E|nr:hypothetical protein [Arthrobacter sp. CG_A4]